MKAQMLFAIAALNFSCATYAQFYVCNKHSAPIKVSAYYLDDPSSNRWMSTAHVLVDTGECRATVSNELRFHYVYVFAKEVSTKRYPKIWRSTGSNESCIPTRDDRESTFRAIKDCSNEHWIRVPFMQVFTGASTSRFAITIGPDSSTYLSAPLPAGIANRTATKEITGVTNADRNRRGNPTEASTQTASSPARVETGEVQRRCIARWEDSQQVHSVETVLELNYQATRTQMKKLVHCAELTVTGPIDVEGISKSYVDRCVEHGLNHQRTRHVVGLIAAIGADIFGTGGVATSAKLTDYVSSVVNETIDCLTNINKFQAHVGDQLKSKFDASIRHESHWEYWNL